MKKKDVSKRKPSTQFQFDLGNTYRMHARTYSGIFAILDECYINDMSLQIIYIYKKKDIIPYIVIGSKAV